MEVWVHQHIFRQLSGGVELIDHLEYQHRRGVWGIFTRLLFGGLPLRFLFFYRHLRTRQLVSNYRTSST
jgi:ligand-binding SRPBCC domain-containing protein